MINCEYLLQNPWLIWVLILILLWDGVWKLVAMWRAARNNQTGWFILLAVLNTVGILPIIYLLLACKKSEQ